MQQPANFIGKVFRHGDADYEAARRASCRNINLPERYPDIIVQATNEKDVVAAVRLANVAATAGRAIMCATEACCSTFRVSTQ